MTAHLIDSSAWIEYFTNGKNSKYFADVIENSTTVIIPSIIIFEVFKKILIERGEAAALTVIAHMKRNKVVDLDLEIALDAAKISKECSLPMADSIIMATALRHDAAIWTQDSDFEKIKGVNFFPKEK